MPIPRTPYAGTHRDLVIAIDFGTTCSGASYSILEPGSLPQIRTVCGFEGQDYSSTKVPSLLYYDAEGNLRAVGAQANNPQLALQAQSERWVEVAWLKLLFRPDDQTFQGAKLPETAAPKNKTPIGVLGDYLHYMMTATKSHIIRSEVDGDRIWTSLENRIVYVLSYPNGWESLKSSILWEASLLGKLVPDEGSARERLRFISEGEASFYWCLENLEAPNEVLVGSDIIVADLGGGTIDVSSFRITSKYPIQLRDNRPPQGRLAGSILVTRAFRKHVEDLPNLNPQAIDYLTAEFDRNTKKAFRIPASNYHVPLGFDVPEHQPDIHQGALLVPGMIIKDMFEPSCQAATEAIENQILPESSRTTVFLVGGFGASPWIFDELRRRLSPRRVLVRRVQSNDTGKAVAEGAIGHYLYTLVSDKIAKVTYGTSATLYNPGNPQHVQRQHEVYTDGGNEYVRGGFTPLWMKDTALGKHWEIRQRVDYRLPLLSCLRPHTVTLELICYQGSKRIVTWQDEDPDSFHTVCTANAVIPASSFKWKARGCWLPYRTLTCWKVFTFATEVPTCRLEWEDNGRWIKHNSDPTPLLATKGKRYSGDDIALESLPLLQDVGSIDP